MYFFQRVIGHLVVFALLLFNYSNGRQTFRGAVYEHAVKDVKINSKKPTRAEIWEALSVNIDPLTEAVNNAKNQGADIIVFPEYAVTGFDFANRAEIFPLLEDIPGIGANPCKSFPKQTIQNWLSCMAKEKKMYIAANVGDVKKCSSKDPSCPADGAYQYNTNVVYDREGKIVHRYHKTNLYGLEVKYMNYGKKRQKNLVFDTPFGRMSTMVCFDIVNKEPGIPITDAGKIDTMLFLTAWMNKYPHFISVQYHPSWARRQHVNLLSAETHDKAWYMTGSGLYTPTGIVKYTFDLKTDKPKLLVADMPIYPRGELMHPSNNVEEMEWVNPEFTSKDYNYVKLSGPEGSVAVCKGILCCKAEYKFSAGTSEKEMYALGVSFAPAYHKKGSLEICVILKCADKKQSNCGQFVDDTTAKFDSLQLSGNFSTSYVYPSVSLSGFQMAQKGQFDMSTIGEIKTDAEELPIVTMVLTGRYYDYCRPPTPSQMSQMSQNLKSLSFCPKMS